MPPVLLALWAQRETIVSALAFLVFVWKTLPAPTRAIFATHFPRIASGFRFFAAVAPDVLGALRIAYHGVLRGQPARPVETTVAINGAVLEAAALDAARRARDTRVPAEPGYAALRPLVLLSLAVVLLMAGAALEGCPDLPTPAGCTPLQTRCSPTGAPEVCSPTQRWTPAEERPCAAVGGVCCWTRSPYGRALHACARAANCLPESADAGAGDAQ